jgi:hypothetical protein
MRGSLRLVLVLLSAAVLMVNCRPAQAITLTFTPTGTLPVGQLQSRVPYAVTLTVSNGTAPYTWSVTSGAFPAGLAWANQSGATVQIYGTPTAGGITSSFTVQVKDKNNNVGSASMSLTIDNMQVTIPSSPGNEIYVNGSPGQLFGWTFVGIDDTTSCATPYYATPWQYWNPNGDNYAATELNYAKSLGANTIRFQVDLDELYEANPPSPNDWSTVEQNYASTIANAVDLARSKGFAVIVSMQWESGVTGSNVCDDDGNTGPTLSGNPASAPGDDYAIDAWTNLFTLSAASNNSWCANNSAGDGVTRNFFNDSGVMIEIYNEPQMTGSTLAGEEADWQAWFTPMNTLASGLRGSFKCNGTDYNPKNIFIIDGLHGARLLDATGYNPYNDGNGGQNITTVNSQNNNKSWLIEDAYNGTGSKNYDIYAVHPYPFVSNGAGYAFGYFGNENDNDEESDFSNMFGNVANSPAMTAPVMVTEWITTSGDAPMCWDNYYPTQPSVLPFGWKGPVDETTFDSVDIKNAFIGWLPTAAPGPNGPNTAPMSMTGNAFEEPGFWLQDAGYEFGLANGSPTPTNFDGQLGDSSPEYYCGEKMDATDGSGTQNNPNPVYLGPGADLSDYFIQYHNSQM